MTLLVSKAFCSLHPFTGVEYGLSNLKSVIWRGRASHHLHEFGGRIRASFPQREAAFGSLEFAHFLHLQILSVQSSKDLWTAHTRHFSSHADISIIFPPRLSVRCCFILSDVSAMQKLWCIIRTTFNADDYDYDILWGLLFQRKSLYFWFEISANFSMSMFTRPWRPSASWVLTVVQTSSFVCHLRPMPPGSIGSLECHSSIQYCSLLNFCVLFGSFIEKVRRGPSHT